MGVTDFLATASRIPDNSAAETFAGVGRSLSSWERVELALARLYSAFVGLPNGEASTQYGAGRIYRQRCDILKRAANNHFITHCNQEWEGGFQYLCADCDELSEIRNKIAHGIVMNTSGFPLFRALHSLSENDGAYYLLPAPYVGSIYPVTVLPTFLFSSHTLSEIASAFLGQEDRIATFRQTCPSLVRP